MARHINWYMDGWEYRNVRGRNGKSKRILVYKGAYYRFDLSARGLAGLRTGYLTLTIALYLAFILYSTGAAQSGGVFYSGIPGMLTIIPLIYLGMGIFCLMIANRHMTYRAYYASMKRIIYSTRIAFVLISVSVISRIIYIMIHIHEEALGLPSEVYGLLYGAICIADIGAMLFLTHRFPVGIVEKNGDNK